MCGDKDRASWWALSSISQLSDDSLTVELSPPVVVQCLRVTVFEMNMGQTIKIGNLAARHKPGLALHHLVMHNWEGDAPKFSSFCQLEERHPALLSGNTCQGPNIGEDGMNFIIIE